MDPSQLASELTKILIPYLLAGGAEIAKGAAGKAGEKLVEQIWSKLRPKVEAKPAAQEAVADVLKAPNDADAQAALRQQIKKILAEDEPLANELRIYVTQGDTNTATVGAGARVEQLAVGKEIYQSIFHVHPGELQDASLPELTRAYFRSLAYECAQLPLGVVDPRFFEAARETRLTVANVYIDLDVTPPARQTREEPFLKRLFRRDRDEEQPDAPKRTPVLEALGREDLARVVLLGDMGSGKSTCVQYLAFALAKIQAGETTGGIAPPLLPENSPLAALAPLRLILRDVARYISPRTTQGDAEMLWRAVRADLEARLGKDAAEKFFPALRMRLLSEPALVLLDGLDEVPEAEERRAHLIQAIEKFCQPLPPATRVVITARPYAYAEPQWQLPQFTSLQLERFSNKQVTRFIEHWYQAVRPEMKWDEPTAQGKANDLSRALAARGDLGDIATRPLLLTLMATVSSSWGTLPNDRFDLYEEMVKLFISRWQRARDARDEKGSLITEQPIAVALAMPESALRQALHQLAFSVHERQAQEKRDNASADISEGEILAAFAPHVGDNTNPRVLLKYLDTRAGLLISRKPGVYVFPHRSFQEYLAACEVSDRVNSTGALRDLARADARWWREVFLWSAGIKARGGIDNVLNIVNAVVPASPHELPRCTEAHYRSAVLAALALDELKTKPAGEEAYDVPLQRVRDWLVQLVETSQLPARERVEAVDLLAKPKDPRPGVGLDARGFPDLVFCEIPPGDFRMGNTKKTNSDADEWEMPQFTYTQLTQPYYITRYPITNAQFEAFVNTPGGYGNNTWWTPEGLQWRGEKRANKKIGGVFDLPNHPVVNVSWYEAVAFANWLNAILQTGECRLQIFNPATRDTDFDANQKSKIRNRKLEIRLPSEAEWEKAARTDDARKYPWKNDITPEHANYAETGIGATSAVGCFPKGANEYGVMDMSGNVWEWCATRWVDSYKDYTKIEKQLNNLEGDSPRVLRGGSFYFVASFVRCAGRGWYLPGDFDRHFGFRVVFAPVASGL